VLLIASAIGAPLAWDHYFSFAPLLLFVPLEIGVRNPLSRVALASAVVMLVPWFRFRRPTASSWWSSCYAFIGRNALLFVSLVMLVTPLLVSSDPARSHGRRAGARTRPHTRRAPVVHATERDDQRASP
jgi:hypothetical protein